MPRLMLVFTFLGISIFSFNTKAESAFEKDPSWMLDAKQNYNRQYIQSSGRENKVMFDEDIGWVLYWSTTGSIIEHLSEAGFNVYIPWVQSGKGTSLEKKPGSFLAKSIEVVRSVWPSSGLAFYHSKHLTAEHIKNLQSTVYSESARLIWSS